MRPRPSQPADPGLAILVLGSTILALSLGLRHAFGLFLDPVSVANGWGRETFAFAMALQNLVWGVAQPFAGAAADRYGARPVILGGGLLYVLGLVGMAIPLGSAGFMLSAGLLIGIGLAGTTFPIVFGAVSRVLPADRRSLAFGIAMAVGSFGQFLALPGALYLIDGIGWASALLVFSALAAAIVPLALAMRTGRAAAPGAVPAGGVPDGAPPGIGAALREAGGTRDFWLLSGGFFVCGFQVVFIAVHLPAFLADEGVSVGIASLVLALIGLVNVVGTLGAGWLGARRPKPGLLAWIYLGRGLAIAAFVLLPITAGSAILFGVAMGLFWLSTVPLTNGVVATLFGVRHLSMLGGFVFLAHQLGGFLGGWLGGLLYDRTGSYDAVWAIAIALSLLAALANLPIRDRPVPRPTAATGPTGGR